MAADVRLEMDNDAGQAYTAASLRSNWQGRRAQMVASSATLPSKASAKISSPCSRHKLKHLDANLGHATIRNPQAARGSDRKVEDAVANPRSAVGNPNHD